MLQLSDTCIKECVCSAAVTQSIFSQMPVEKQSVTEEDKEGDRELVAKNLRGEINPQAKEYVTVWEVEAGQTVRGTTAR